MIQVALLMILVCVGGSLGDDVLCHRKVRKECDISKFPKDIPETSEDLRDACSATKVLLRCVIRVNENCSDRNEDIVEFFRSIKNYIDEICKEDSFVYQVISNNLQCIRNASRIVEETCDLNNASPQNQELIRSHATALLEAENHVNEDNSVCLYEYGSIACRSMTIGFYCGRETKDVLFEMLGKTNFHYRQCSEEARNDLETLNGVIEMAVIDELNSRNANQEDEE